MKKVLLLLAKGFEFYEASVFIDVFGWNFVDGNHDTRLYTCGRTKSVSGAFKQIVTVDFIIDEINVDDFDALAIPGGFEEYGFYKDAFHPAFLQLINDFYSKGKIVASVCVGAIVLAESGILQEKTATTYIINPKRQEMLRNYPNITVLQQPIVEDGNILTSWGPSTAMDVAFRVLERLTDSENAAFIRKIMGFS